VGITGPQVAGQSEIDFRCAPNPVTDQMMITFSLQAEQEISLKLYDLLGKGSLHRGFRES